MFELQNTIIRRIFATIFAVEQLVRSLFQHDIPFTVGTTLAIEIPRHSQKSHIHTILCRHINLFRPWWRPLASRCIFHWSSALIISFNESCCTQEYHMPLYVFFLRFQSSRFKLQLSLRVQTIKFSSDTLHQLKARPFCHVVAVIVVYYYTSL